MLLERELVRQTRGIEMREVRSVAEVMRDKIARLKAQTTTALGAFNDEVQRADENLKKVDALTSELKDANRDVEQMLRESGSNFPTSDLPAQSPVEVPQPQLQQASLLSNQLAYGLPDKNGVILNRNA